MLIARISQALNKYMNFNISKITTDGPILIWDGKINYAFPDLEAIKERADRYPKQQDLGLQAMAQNLMDNFIVTIPPQASVVAREAIKAALRGVIDRVIVY